MSNDRPEELHLTPDQVRDIIERAGRMPARGDTISLYELREIAAELDIDPKSLEQALKEVLSESAPSHSKGLGGRVRRFFQSWSTSRRVAVGAAAGTALGVASGFLSLAIRLVRDGITIMLGSNAYIDVPVAIVLSILSLGALLYHRKSGALKNYLLEIIGLWGSFYVGWVLVRGSLTDDLTIFVATGIGIATVAGRLFIRREPPPETARGQVELILPMDREDDEPIRVDQFSRQGIVSPTWLGLSGKSPAKGTT